MALFLAGGAFSALALLQLSARRDEEEIVLTPSVVEGLAEERAELLGRPVTEGERQRLAEEWVAQEVLVREARKRGLDREDAVVRQRLVERMRTVLREPAKEPTRDELVAFHGRHRERYQSAERVSVEHVFLFKTAATPTQAAALLGDLRSGADFRRMGQPFWLGPVLQGVTQPELGRVLGDAFARSVFAASSGAWSGPFESVRGVHLVRVTARRPAEAAPFEEVENQVRQDWLEERERLALDRHVTELQKAYRVTRPSPSP